jgi:hypothetical protein
MSTGDGADRIVVAGVIDMKKEQRKRLNVF